MYHMQDVSRAKMYHVWNVSRAKMYRIQNVLRAKYITCKMYYLHYKNVIVQNKGEGFQR